MTLPQYDRELRDRQHLLYQQAHWYVRGRLEGRGLDPVRARRMHPAAYADAVAFIYAQLVAFTVTLPPDHDATVSYEA